MLKDIINSGVCPVTRLKKIYRQDEQEVLCENAQRINSGDANIKNGSDFEFIDTLDPLMMEQIMKECVIELSKEYGFGNVLCLCPRKENAAGVRQMNQILQESLNPPCERKNEIKAHGMTFREGDFVMHINHNTPEASNGVIKSIEGGDGKKCVVATINGIDIKYVGIDLENLTLAYAMTVHKSQGAQAAAVVTCIHEIHGAYVTRALPYVAMTRGKKRVEMIGTRTALERAVNNDEVIRRVSLLQHFLELESIHTAMNTRRMNEYWIAEKIKGECHDKKDTVLVSGTPCCSWRNNCQG